MPKHRKARDADWREAFLKEHDERAAKTIYRAARLWYAGDITAMKLRAIVARCEAQREMRDVR